METNTLAFGRYVVEGETAWESVDGISLNDDDEALIVVGPAGRTEWRNWGQLVRLPENGYLAGQYRRPLRSTPATYALLQAAWVEHFRVKVGTRVRVMRLSHEYDLGWPDDWISPDMDECVGKTLIVNGIDPKFGIELVDESEDERDWTFPFHVLTVLPEPTIEQLCDEPVRMTAEEWQRLASDLSKKVRRGDITVLPEVSQPAEAREVDGKWFVDEREFTPPHCCGCSSEDYSDHSLSCRYYLRGRAARWEKKANELTTENAALAATVAGMREALEAIRKNDPIVSLVCEHMPEGWTLDITLERNAGVMELRDTKDGREVEFCDDDLTFWEQAEQRVNHARIKEGMTPVAFFHPANVDDIDAIDKQAAADKFFPVQFAKDVAAIHAAQPTLPAAPGEGEVGKYFVDEREFTPPHCCGCSSEDYSDHSLSCRYYLRGKAARWEARATAAEAERDAARGEVERLRQSLTATRNAIYEIWHHASMPSVQAGTMAVMESIDAALTTASVGGGETEQKGAPDAG